MENHTRISEAELYTVPQICEKTGLSRAKIYELISTNNLPSVKIHSSRRVRRKDFEAWVDALGEDGE
jgi:excisionase family DNA binding protein